jgi:hypothetical protein
VLTERPNNNNNTNNTNKCKPTEPFLTTNWTSLSVIKKATENILKYKDLTTEIHHAWNVKSKVISVVIRATGSISKSLRQYLSNITGKHEIKELQKTAMLGTGHKLREVLM